VILFLLCETLMIEQAVAGLRVSVATDRISATMAALQIATPQPCVENTAKTQTCRAG
jgi:hypothetical protein